MQSTEVAKKVVKTEIEGLEHMLENLDNNFNVAVKEILGSCGRVIICGMGKSGIIAKKISASFASTGTPSFFMHPGEAFHGDLGMVKPEDIFLAISYSGETEELLRLLPFLEANKNYIIAITGNSESTLSRRSQCNLNVAVPREACHLELAPTSSTTATLVMGDALTVALMEERDFRPEHFARFHPGGSLGRRLLNTVRDEMIAYDLPVVSKDDSLIDVIHQITSGKLGLALTFSTNDGYSIITDGDLRRATEKYGRKIFDLTAKDLLVKDPITITPDTNIQVAYDLMNKNRITSLIVVDEEKVVGILKMQ